VSATTARTRARARVEGTVQGVGFRPFVHRLAGEHGLAGWVRNDERGVLLEVEGEAASVAAFLRRLPVEAPPMAAIDAVRSERVAPEGERAFRIVESARGGEPLALVTPDATTCDDCLAELFDPGDRRYRYPFVNCTNCGPRFTIVRDVPYDRPLTTMAGFTMCAACRAEYEDPGDRRFHAQPNACPACGPSVALAGRDGEVSARDDDALREAAATLVRGEIVAVKGLGGYHLACRADDEAAVAALRERKHREDRPFALMAPSLHAARALVELGEEDERLLLGRERPIVIARRHREARVAPSVAPGSADLGVMLAYTPLHHVLMGDVTEMLGRDSERAAAGDALGALVMTSANRSDEPIAFRDDDALERLGGIADLFLMHDRPVHMRTDDSVVRAQPGRRPLLLRRSRGYVPSSTTLPVPARDPLLACGAEQKNAFCVAKGAHAWLSHHIGDLKTWETLRSFREGVEHFERLFAVAPAVVAHDLHPDYLSTRYALERDGVRHVAVQHHHAHHAACLAEHGETGSAVGAIFDGTGYGEDGTIWGGELLVGGLRSVQRAGHLRAVPLPGGAQAIREPWRMACAWLAEAHGTPEPALPATLARDVDPRSWAAIARIASDPHLSPTTSSAGRLFDAVAALCGIGATVTYEGQVAVELEAAADPAERGAYPIDLDERPARAGDPGESPAPTGDPGERPAPAVDPGESPALVLDPRGSVLLVARDVAAGVPAGVVSARFHRGLAAATAAACERLAHEHRLDTVVLSGGVFCNRLLTGRTAELMERAGLRVLLHERIPANDGGIAYGQAAVAAAGGRG
jgi:hydrogenase maturation protein HypF